MSSAAGRASCVAVVLAVVLAIVAACGRTPYPMPAPRASTAPTEPSIVATKDAGDAERVRAAERQCRLRLSGTTAEASLAALDRVHEVLGAGCDITTVEHDPLHWLLRCRSDALFERGAYRLRGRDVACSERGGAKLSPWTCTGAVLRELLAGTGGAAAGVLASLELAVFGHADRILPRPGTDAHVCSELHQALGYTPRGRWSAVSEDALDEERTYANHQLAWCRAASVAEQLTRGLAGGDVERPAALDAVDLAVLGMGTSWLASQPDARCPGAAGIEPGDCSEARRVDVLLRFTPRVETRVEACPEQASGARSALWCLQDCMERLALGVSGGAGVAASTSPLFTEGTDPEALPVGWYLHRAPPVPSKRLAFERACAVLGIDPAQCGVR